MRHPPSLRRCPGAKKDLVVVLSSSLGDERSRAGVQPEADPTRTVLLAIVYSFVGVVLAGYLEIFSVKVASVNTANRQGKRKRTRTGFGKRKDTKRAIVTLVSGSKPIDIFGAPA